MIKINNELFTTKSALKRHFLKVVKNLDGIAEIGSYTDLFLRGLLKNHPAYLLSRDGIEDPIFYRGVRLVGYGLNPNPRYKKGTKGLFYIANDGKKYFASNKKCINGGISSYHKLAQAFRFYIEEQRAAFISENLTSKSVCAITKVPLIDKEIHVDHNNPSFKKLMDGFIIKYNIDPSRLVFEKPENESWIIKDQSTILNWKDYHLKNANLQLVTKKANLTKKRNE